MKFKTQQIESEFYTGGLHKVLIWEIHILDYALKIYRFFHSKTAKELMVTDLLRENPQSYHSKGQAADIRTFDWDLTQKRLVGGMLEYLKRLSHGQLQYEFEPNERFPDADPHVHVEFDDGSIKKESV